MRTATLAVSAFCMLASGGLQAAGFKTGQWEYTTRIEGGGMPAIPKMSAEEQAEIEAAMKQLPPGMTLPGGMSVDGFGLGGGGMSFTVSQCMRDENPVPPTKSGPDGQDCKPTKVDHKGNQVNWVVHCDGKDGVMDGEGSASYSGDTMTSKMHMQGNSHGQPVDMTMNTSGRYLGACR